MKILVVSLLGRGGMTHYTSQLVNSLSKENEVAVILPEHADQGYFNKAVRIITIKAPANILYTLILSLNIMAFIGLIKMIKRMEPEVIHIMNNHPWNTIICIMNWKHVKKVYTLHDPKPHEQALTSLLLQPIFSFIDHFTIAWANRVIVHGKTLKSDLIESGISEDKISVIPHGDYTFFLKYAPKYIERKKSVKRILFFGRIEPYKGIEYLIKSSIDVKAAFPEALFVIAGDGNFKPYINMVKDDPSFVIYNRYIPDEEVAELFCASDIVVLPYISATQSGVIQIAFAFKKPVIATCVGAIPEVVENNVTGLLVPPKNSEELAKAIIKVLSEPDLSDILANNAYQKMKNDLAWEEISYKTEQLYRHIT